MAIFAKKQEAFSVLPESIGIIMDGNGRWAKKRGLPRKAGHKKGASVFETISTLCADLGIPYVTFYAFSCENWNRPKEEVDALMGLFQQYLEDAEQNQEKSKNIILRFIGEREGLNDNLLRLMEKAEKGTKDHTGTVVNLAINYGGRQEIVAAVKSICRSIERGEKKIEEITPEEIGAHLYTAGQKEPDLIIRPSGEQRLSNFMIWQAAYAELWYSDVLWPDFGKKELYEALHAYEQRNRRFGG